MVERWDQEQEPSFHEMPHTVGEWFAFEGWLCVRLSARIGLVCAYSAADVMHHDIIAQVLKTHAYRFGPT